MGRFKIVFKAKSSIFYQFCSKKGAKIWSHIAPTKMSRTHAHPAHFSEWISHTHAHVWPHIARVRARTHLRNSYLAVMHATSIGLIEYWIEQLAKIQIRFGSRFEVQDTNFITSWLICYLEFCTTNILILVQFTYKQFNWPNIALGNLDVHIHCFFIQEADWKRQL